MSPEHMPDGIQPGIQTPRFVGFATLNCLNEFGTVLREKTGKDAIPSIRTGNHRLCRVPISAIAQ